MDGMDVNVVGWRVVGWVGGSARLAEHTEALALSSSLSEEEEEEWWGSSSGLSSPSPEIFPTNWETLAAENAAAAFAFDARPLNMAKRR